MTQPATQPRAAMRGITKRFPGVVANDAITLDFHAGELHVLLGENGAGKSTLIGMLAGMLQPDSGEILVDGRAVTIVSPRASLTLGIGTVFQHVLLVPTLSVIANLMLGGTWWRPLNRRAALVRFRELSALLGVAIDPDILVGALSLGEQQQVEIMRALWHGEKVLILDEPTSMLTPQGVKDLGAVLTRLLERGVAVILITHKLTEAYEFGDRISVLRRGKLVGALPPDQLQMMDEQAASDAVIEMMFGTTADHERDADLLAGHGWHALRAHPVDRSRPPRLKATDLATGMLRGVSLELWPGEVLGIAGIDGNGQKHLAEALAGQRGAQGSIRLDGADITRERVAERRARGIRYLTDERVGEGIVSGFSVAANLVLKEIGAPPFWRSGVTDWKRIHEYGKAAIARHDIRAPSERTPVGRLSGGNIQKVLLARELDEKARVVIYNKPTQGLDLNNTRLAHDRILAGAEAGLATIVISTDLAELLELSDRIAVMVRGRIVGVVDNGPEVERTIGALMTGARTA